MFEKEAEENGFGIGCTVNPTTAFQKGAEFGYNKANEWHFMKDEMKDKISMALKDPTLQQGFEIICKNLAELEKENAELKKLRCCENCKNINLQLHWRESKKIDERRQFICGTCGDRKHWEYSGKTIGITETQKLTKAKEIIKKLYSHIFQGMGFMEINDYNVQKAEAEQFLKEE